MGSLLFSIYSSLSTYLPSPAKPLTVTPCRSGADSDGAALGLPFTPVVLTFKDISYYVPAPSSHV